MKLTVQFSIWKLLALAAIVGLTLGANFFVSAAGTRRGVISETAYLQAPAGDPVPGGPGFVSIDSYFFKAYPTNLEYSYAGSKLQNPGAEPRYFVAGVQLPHGATVTKFVVFYLDATDFYDFTAALVVGGFDVDTFSQMATVSPSGSDPNIRYIQDASIDFSTVDNQTRHYAVQVWMPPTTQISLIAVRIDYQYASSLPLVAK
ncbi:MAG: hypothetical protein JXB15_13920 [Anaerolineales bacterium]|nr:hypothetical protein [Anaerolineales bacterium]